MQASASHCDFTKFLDHENSSKAYKETNAEKQLMAGLFKQVHFLEIHNST